MHSRKNGWIECDNGWRECEHGEAVEEKKIDTTSSKTINVRNACQ